MRQEDIETASTVLKKAGVLLERRIVASNYVLGNGTVIYDSVLTVLSGLKNDLVAFSDLLGQVSLFIQFTIIHIHI